MKKTIVAVALNKENEIYKASLVTGEIESAGQIWDSMNLLGIEYALVVDGVEYDFGELQRNDVAKLFELVKKINVLI